MFLNGILSRLDLNYSRRIEANEDNLILDFFQKSQEKINVKIESNLKGLILKIANRRSSNCARIYTNKKFLKFELEMKNKFIKNYNSLMVENRFDQMEFELVDHYISYFGKLLPLKFPYTDWLSRKLRPIHPNNRINIKPPLPTDYMKSEDEIEKIDSKKLVLFFFLKFLKFVKELDYKSETFGESSYRKIEFKVKDFVKICESHFNFKNEYYKLEKTRDYLLELQTNLHITSFSDSYFRNIISIPKLELFKCKKSRSWKARVFVIEELFSYQYPFVLPDFFGTDHKMSKDEFAVRFEIISVFSSVDVEKQFFLQKFFGSKNISNKKRRGMKQMFIELVQDLEKDNFIESEVKLMVHDSRVDISELTTNKISNGFIIYEKII